jgi:carbon-monoxide dehydrogenase small subunit
MTRLTMRVNGAVVTADVEPRTHLADFLREDRGLTGTHLGCEHGVCGACTLLIDGAPARSCIAYAVACEDAEIHTIEGLDSDPTIVRLRAAFTAEHALQCGYCTPGMLMTARDIVHRLPHADEAAIRMELTGNLCRCTGYAGIVRAIRSVLADGVTLPAAEPPKLPMFVDAPPVVTETVRATAVPPNGAQIRRTLRIDLPLHEVWDAIRDPALVASCVPGARLSSVDGNRLSGEVHATLGPIETRFTGDGTMAFDELNRRAELSGEGIDAKTGTRLSGRAVLTLRELNASATEAALSIDYSLRGPLAQFARAAVVREFVSEIALGVARDLTARLRGTPIVPPPQLAVGGLLWRMVARWLRTALGRP